MVFCSTHAQVCHAASVVFPVDFDCGEHVYRVYPINVQLVSDPVIMPAKEEHGCNSGSESLEKHEPRDILKDVITVSLLQKGQNDRIKNIVSVFYGIQWHDYQNHWGMASLSTDITKCPLKPLAFGMCLKSTNEVGNRVHTNVTDIERGGEAFKTGVTIFNFLCHLLSYTVISKNRKF